MEPSSALSALDHLCREAPRHPARTEDADGPGGSECVPVLPSHSPCGERRQRACCYADTQMFSQFWLVKAAAAWVIPGSQNSSKCQRKQATIRPPTLLLALLCASMPSSFRSALKCSEWQDRKIRACSALAAMTFTLPFLRSMNTSPLSTTNVLALRRTALFWFW